MVLLSGCGKPVGCFIRGLFGSGQGWAFFVSQLCVVVLFFALGGWGCVII
jgi:hypothetical protein